MRFQKPLTEWVINSSFGNRIHPITKDIRFHNGIDLKANFVPFYSIAEGTVKKVYTSGPGGKTLIVSHPGNYESGFAHLDKINVSEGEKVQQGQILGITGNSGTSTTGPHLHYRVKLNDEYIDPAKLNYNGSNNLNVWPWLLAGGFFMFLLFKNENQDKKK